MKFQTEKKIVEITYIMNSHQELEKIVEVSSAVYISMYLANIYYLRTVLEIDFLLSFFMFYFQVCFVLTLAEERSSWRHIKKY